MMMAAATADHEARALARARDARDVRSLRIRFPSLSLILFFLRFRGSPLGLGSHGTPGRLLGFPAVSAVCEPSSLLRFP